MASAVASRYAKALVDVVLASPVESSRVRQELLAFVQSLSDSPDLSNALASPAVPRARKRAVIGRLAESLGLSKIARNFLLVLIDHRRLGDLSGIIAAFENLMNERQGLLRVEVTSARELHDRQQAALVQELERVTGKKIELDLTVDSALVGGMVVRMGSTVYDGSVRGRLESLARRLVGRASARAGL